ncbi:SDR family NAD(P)-dependent oxidoreductase [Dactylosporangium sp. CA-092794]|uniref:SDR family NAD(P)-dependent oxidoreductase n=1 Tax=Dactylosporangium sp. CA-092794 TaxID=3239929 RepID=UPI003D8D0AAD
MTGGAIYPSLAGRVVFVSGGATGLGAEFVAQFAAQGCAVGFADIDEAGARALVDRLTPTAAVAPMFVPADVCDIPRYTAAIRAVAGALGPIGVLVNNAANDERHRTAEVTEAYWDASIAVNLRHHFFACQAVIDGMRAAGGGSIINLGSIASHAQFTGMPAYITAKAGIEGLTHTLARELGPDRIRVNCVVPGWVMTERQLAARLDAAAETTIERNQCLRERVMPSDVAALVLWLAAQDSALVTGQMLAVNGGWV